MPRNVQHVPQAGHELRNRRVGDGAVALEAERGRQPGPHRVAKGRIEGLKWHHSLGPAKLDNSDLANFKPERSRGEQGG